MLSDLITRTTFSRIFCLVVLPSAYDNRLIPFHNYLLYFLSIRTVVSTQANVCWSFEIIIFTWCVLAIFAVWQAAIGLPHNRQPSAGSRNSHTNTYDQANENGFYEDQKTLNAIESRKEKNFAYIFSTVPPQLSTAPIAGAVFESFARPHVSAQR